MKARASCPRIGELLEAYKLADRLSIGGGLDFRLSKVKLARRPELLAGAREERGFLLRLARNLAIDQMRRRETRGRKHAESAEEMASIFAPAIAGEVTPGP